MAICNSPQEISSPFFSKWICIKSIRYDIIQPVRHRDGQTLTRGRLGKPVTPGRKISFLRPTRPFSGPTRLGDLPDDVVSLSSSRMVQDRGPRSMSGQKWTSYGSKKAPMGQVDRDPGSHMTSGTGGKYPSKFAPSAKGLFL